MPGGIYLVRDDDELVEMNETPYDSEDLLQELLAKYPNLLAGDQMSADAPRRWLLVSREMRLPSDELQGGRWSVDHLFLDQEGIPTLVEVKRSSDTRLRREVVGQLLEYAANAVLYWPIARIMEEYDQECGKRGLDPEDQLIHLIGGDDDTTSFWERVRTNLQAGRIRLVFVADVIPSELRRIVEFLNEQMDPADVFAVEVKQFSGGGLTTLVPRLIGSSERKHIQRVGRRASPWNEGSFLEALGAASGREAVEVAQGVMQWARGKGLREWWGTGARNGSFVPILDTKNRWHSILTIWTGGTFEILFQYFANWEPFTSEDKRLQLLEKLNAVPGIALPAEAINKRPSIQLTDIHQAGNLDALLEVHSWIIDQFKSAEG